MEAQQLKREYLFIKDIFRRVESEEGRRLVDKIYERYNIKKPTRDTFGPDIKDEEIIRTLVASYIGRSLHNSTESRVRHNLTNNPATDGIPEELTAEERLRLKDTLRTLAREIQELSDRI